ncbi:DUF1684 domain-containing protein [Xanthomonas massiliensis]|uniref:DUF1684 domain-containing protein n=1 Tax=Xanthomonas massiliensis TaxID=1720302 RepID=UPI00082592A8|nr:DUF1684 domain-containing protein [Xanthomonas massiliensis]
MRNFWLCLCALGLASGLAACSGASLSEDGSGDRDGRLAYAREIAQWRRARMERLRAPEGWLSYVGAGRLRPGRYRIGRDPDNDVVLPAGPDHLGVLTLQADGRLGLVAQAPVKVDGTAFERGELEWQPDHLRSHGVEWGQVQFYVVRLGPSSFGWRVRDPDSPARRGFKGIAHFEVDPDWRIEADWHPFTPARPLTLLTSVATPQAVEVPGEAVFVREGQTFRLQPVLDEDGHHLFFLFTDRTSGTETFGGARYLRSELPRGGKVVLDFNRTVNPPCAISPYVVCPLAPPGNRLDLAVTAGEKNYLPSH